MAPRCRIIMYPVAIMLKLFCIRKLFILCRWIFSLFLDDYIRKCPIHSSGFLLPARIFLYFRHRTSNHEEAQRHCGEKRWVWTSGSSGRCRKSSFVFVLLSFCSTIRVSVQSLACFYSATTLFFFNHRRVSVQNWPMRCWPTHTRGETLRAASSSRTNR